MQDRIDRLSEYVRRLKAENAELIEEAAELRADREALLRLVAELREGREVRQVSNSPNLPTDDSGAST